MSRTGAQPRCIKLRAKVQTAKWAKFISGSEGQWPNCFPDGAPAKDIGEDI